MQAMETSAFIVAEQIRNLTTETEEQNPNTNILYVELSNGNDTVKIPLENLQHSSKIIQDISKISTHKGSNSNSLKLTYTDIPGLTLFLIKGIMERLDLICRTVNGNLNETETQTAQKNPFFQSLLKLSKKDIDALINAINLLEIAKSEIICFLESINFFNHDAERVFITNGRITISLLEKAATRSITIQKDITEARARQSFNEKTLPYSQLSDTQLRLIGEILKKINELSIENNNDPLNYDFLKDLLKNAQLADLIDLIICINFLDIQDIIDPVIDIYFKACADADQNFKNKEKKISWSNLGITELCPKQISDYIELKYNNCISQKNKEQETGYFTSFFPYFFASPQAPSEASTQGQLVEKVKPAISLVVENKQEVKEIVQEAKLASNVPYQYQLYMNFYNAKQKQIATLHDTAIESPAAKKTKGEIVEEAQVRLETCVIL